MNRRRALMACALGAALVASAVYVAALQRVEIAVAARDIPADRAIEEADLASRSLPPDAVPSTALRDAGALVGRHPRAPIAAGQVMVSGAVQDEIALFSSGLLPPAGTRAVALPVGPAQALGGAVQPGARIDVVAVPLAGRAPAGRTTELLAARALVLDVRAETGGAMGRSRASAAVADRLGSVVIAVPTAELLRVADRIATSTFVLLLASDR